MAAGCFAGAKCNAGGLSGGAFGAAVRRERTLSPILFCRHHKREGQYEGFVQALADHYAANGSSGPTLIWRDNSPQHFDIENGVHVG